jgi:DNA-binding PadR family transcriptional regulator
MNPTKIKIIPRGALRDYVLAILKKNEMCGSLLIKTIQKNTTFWKPSSGTLYPLLKKLKKENLIQDRKDKNKKIYFLTEKGKKEKTSLSKLTNNMHEQLTNSLSLLLNVDKKILSKNLFNDKNKEILRENFREILIELARLNSKEQIKKSKTILEKSVTSLKKIR